MRLITDPLVDFVLDLCIPYIWSIIGEPVKSFIPENIQLALNSIQQQFSQGVETLTETAVSNHTQVVSEATTSFSNNGTSHLAQLDWNLLQAKFESWGTVALARWHQFAAGQTGLDRSMCILVGYIVLIYIGSWYLSLGRRRSTASTEFVQDIIRQQGIFLKVFFFIVIELVIFPTTCGFLLDLATLPLFVNASFASRYVFHLKSPYASYFLHWFLGTGILFYFAIFITVCREIIRPGVMWFLRDPSDPQFNPVQEMVQKPFGSLMRKISQSALIYSIMLVFGVGTVTYTLSLTGIVFPLRLPLDVPLSTLSIDLLIIQFLLPPLIALVKPRDYSKKALDLWWHFACRQLRLTSFMFNQRMPDEEGEHVRRTLKAWLCMKKAPIPEGVFEEVGIDLDQDEDSSVVFRRNGAMMRVPKLDSVPVDPTRPMLIPVDPVSLEPLIEEERGRKHPAAADTNDEAQSTIIVYVPPHFKHRVRIKLS
jgi:E3 ubiquitin-protein ligase DOA10